MQFDGHAKTPGGNWRFPPAAVRLPHRGRVQKSSFGAISSTFSSSCGEWPNTVSQNVARSSIPVIERVSGCSQSKLIANPAFSSIPTRQLLAWSCWRAECRTNFLV